MPNSRFAPFTGGFAAASCCNASIASRSRPCTSLLCATSKVIAVAGSEDAGNGVTVCPKTEAAGIRQIIVITTFRIAALMITRPGLTIHGWQRKTRRTSPSCLQLHLGLGAFQPCERQQHCRLCIYLHRRAWMASIMVWTDDPHLDIQTAIFRCPQVFTGDYSSRT